MADTKDYILNIRVSRNTYEKIKTKAKENGQSVSTLVRKAIDDGAEIISDLSRELFNRKTSSVGEDGDLEFPGVTSYHRARLAVACPCAKCKKEMIVGDVVTVGQEVGGKVYYFCELCR